MRKTRLEDLGKLQIEIDVQPLLKKTAQECAKEINQNIAEKRWKGNYANSWIARKVPNGYKCKSKEYRLTHLLENGHLIVNKKNGVGYSAPREHIAPAYKKMKKKLIDEAEKLPIKIKIE